MTRTIKAVAIQMDAVLAPTDERLERAERLVNGAVESGAELVVLPELFNTGYGYTDENFRRAETITGKTASWLKRTAAEYDIHLAGSLMLLDREEIYNALLLSAPDGRMWRYDKNYPWGWERAYFRGRKGITIAETELGRIGMLICWDAAHLDLWQQYEGQVDLMVISSCPPDVTNPTFVFPTGEKVTFEDFGRMGELLKDTGRLLFGEMVNQQTAWLGVPTVQTTGVGHIRTEIPHGLLSMLSYLPIAPKLIRYLRQANKVALESDFVQGCKIVDCEGNVQAELEQSEGESFVVGDVLLLSQSPRRKQSQPKSLLPKIAYFSSDILLPLLMRSIYRRGVRKIEGKERIVANP